VWHWTAHHPDWRGGQGWDPEVSSYAVDDGENLLLFDPVAPSALVDELAAGRHPMVYVPPPDEGDPEPVRGEVYEAGDELPFGVKALPGLEPNDLVLWIESKRALVLGDTLLDRGEGIQFARDWARMGAIAERGVPPEQLLERLQPLRELPVELVLATHGGPFDRAALLLALSGPARG
jgi:glyoxylase-like metal-dependent hydrolase (beta-lactamase superfamily II)